VRTILSLGTTFKCVHGSTALTYLSCAALGLLLAEQAKSRAEQGNIERKNFNL